MPIRFTYDRHLKILFTTAEGVVSFVEIQQHLDEESAAKALGYREIVDASDASASLTAEEARKLARCLETMLRHGPFGPTAIVAGNDFTFGMARMIAILSELWCGPRVAVFRSVAEGLDWLVHESPE
jgi:hypothetical protein